MINNISLQPLRNGACIQFLTDTLRIVSKNNPKAYLKRLLYATARFPSFLFAMDGQVLI